MHVGSPKTVARNIAKTVSELGAARFDFKYSAGTLPHDAMMRSIVLFAREVIPTVPTVTDAVPMPTNPK